MKHIERNISTMIFPAMLVIALFAGTSAQADDKKKLDHRHQGVVNVLLGFGGFMVAPYDKDNPLKACSEIDSKDGGDPVCTGRSGVHMDLLGGFGVASGIEVFAMMRLGLEDAALGRPKSRMIGAGIKVYSPSDGLFKIGFGVAPLFDFSERKVETYDFMIHVPILAQFDVSQWFAPYIQVSPNISVVTEFRIEILAGIGIQGRFP